MERTIRVPASFEQNEEIMEHFISGKPLRILSSERPRLLRCVARQFPQQKISGAELDIETGDWQVTIT